MSRLADAPQSDVIACLDARYRTYITLFMAAERDGLVHTMAEIKLVLADLRTILLESERSHRLDTETKSICSETDCEEKFTVETDARLKDERIETAQDTAPDGFGEYRLLTGDIPCAPLMKHSPVQSTS